MRYTLGKHYLSLSLIKFLEAQPRPDWDYSLLITHPWGRDSCQDTLVLAWHASYDCLQNPNHRHRVCMAWYEKVWTEKKSHFQRHRTESKKKYCTIKSNRISPCLCWCRECHKVVYSASCLGWRDKESHSMCFVPWGWCTRCTETKHWVVCTIFFTS